MKFEFKDPHLEQVYCDKTETLGFGVAVDKGFRKAVGWIDIAVDELSLRNYKSLHYHKLDGDRSHQHGIDVTNKYRLVVERVKENESISLLLVEVVDYH